MRDSHIHAVVSEVKKTIRRWKEPVLGVVARETRDPFRILIACLLSLRTKDHTTAEASQRLFQLADTPEHMRALSMETIEKALSGGISKTKPNRFLRFAKAFSGLWRTGSDTIENHVRRRTQERPIWW